MGEKHSLVMSAAVALVLATTACSQAAVPAAPAAIPSSSLFHGGQQERVPNEYLVTLSAGVDEKVLAEVYGRYGIKEIGPLGNSVFLLTLTSDPGPQVVADLIHGDVRFKAVQPNLIYRIKQPGKKAE